MDSQEQIKALSKRKNELYVSAVRPFKVKDSRENWVRG